MDGELATPAWRIRNRILWLRFEPGELRLEGRLAAFTLENGSLVFRAPLEDVRASAGAGGGLGGFDLPGRFRGRILNLLKPLHGGRGRFLKDRTCAATVASSGKRARMASRLAWSAGSRSPGLVMTQAVIARDLGGLGRGRARGVSAGTREMVPDAGVPAGVASGADLLTQLRGVGASAVPPFPQVRLIVVQDASVLRRPVADEELAGVGGAAEPAHGVAGQAELGGYRSQAAAVSADREDPLCQHFRQVRKQNISNIKIARRA
jgi:hypothetical protein